MRNALISWLLWKVQRFVQWNRLQAQGEDCRPGKGRQADSQTAVHVSSSSQPWVRAAPWQSPPTLRASRHGSRSSVEGGQQEPNGADHGALLLRALRLALRLLRLLPGLVQLAPRVRQLQRQAVALRCQAVAALQGGRQLLRAALPLRLQLRGAGHRRSVLLRQAVALGLHNTTGASGNSNWQQQSADNWVGCRL